MSGNLLKTALSRGSEPKGKDLSIILHWFKQIVGLLVGSAFGVLKVSGLFGLLLGVAAVCGIGYLYAKNYLMVDEDEVENTEILSEGMGVGFACFMLTWILGFSYF